MAAAVAAASLGREFRKANQMLPRSRQMSVEDVDAAFSFCHESMKLPVSIPIEKVTKCCELVGNF